MACADGDADIVATAAPTCIPSLASAASPITLDDLHESIIVRA
jgi:hypothetical protein